MTDWLVISDEGELTLDNLDWLAEGKRTLAWAALVLQSTAALGARELRWGGALGIILHPWVFSTFLRAGRVWWFGWRVFGRRNERGRGFGAAVSVSLRLQLRGNVFVGWGAALVVSCALQRRVVHLALQLGKLHLLSYLCLIVLKRMYFVVEIVEFSDKFYFSI